jgi:hypothetical protein
LDRRENAINLDRIGEGRIPNVRNSEFISNWIGEGNISEPYRLMYPLQREVSYVPFRARRLNRVNGQIEAYTYGKSRLDFYLVDNTLLNYILEVKYEDRLGRDFDHKEVTLQIGKKIRVGQINIRNSTLEDSNVKHFGTISLYDTVNEHLLYPSNEIRNTVGRLDNLIRQRGNVVNMEEREHIERIELIDREIDVCITELPNVEEILANEHICNYKNLYEVVTMNLKNRLVAYQVKKQTDNIRVHANLVQEVKDKGSRYGENSVQWLEAQDNLLQYNDNKLKEKTGKYREFFNNNNEKMGSSFCKLGKKGMGLDNTSQIRDKGGKEFENSKQRG